MPAASVHACTDITGFGLLGHASEMAAASGCSLEIDAAAVPLLEGARELVSGNVPGGGRTNRQHFGARIDDRRIRGRRAWPTCCSIRRRPAACCRDRSTAPPTRTLAALRAIGVPAAVVGDVPRRRRSADPGPLGAIPRDFAGRFGHIVRRTYKLLVAPAALSMV